MTWSAGLGLIILVIFFCPTCVSHGVYQSSIKEAILCYFEINFSISP